MDRKTQFFNNLKTEKFKQIKNIDTNTAAGQAILKVREKFRGIVGDSGFLLLNLMYLARFMILHDKFASKGIFITDENKEDKYIEILEQDDEEMLNDLEKYIESLEKIEIIDKCIQEYDTIIDEIKMLDENDKEGIDKVINEYLNR